MTHQNHHPEISSSVSIPDVRSQPDATTAFTVSPSVPPDPPVFSFLCDMHDVQSQVDDAQISPGESLRIVTSQELISLVTRSP